MKLQNMAMRLMGSVADWNEWIKKEDFTNYAELSKCSFPENMNLTGIRIPGLYFTYSILNGVIFDTGVLQAVEFDNAKLQRASFRDAHIGGIWSRRVDPGTILDFVTSFRGADLTGADFTGADAKNCDFRGATLVNAKFVDTDISDALFDSVAADKLDLSRARGKPKIIVSKKPVSLGDAKDGFVKTQNADDIVDTQAKHTDGVQIALDSSNIKIKMRIISIDIDNDEIAISTDAVNEIKIELRKLRVALHANIQQNEILANVETDIKMIETEIERPSVRKSVIALFFESLRDNLAKSIGAATASGIIAGLGIVIAKYFGVM